MDQMRPDPGMAFLDRKPVVHRHIIALLFTIIALTIAGTARSEPVNLDDDPAWYRVIVGEVEVQFDESLRLGPNEILELSEQFTPVTSSFTDFGLMSDRVWLRFSVVNETGAEGIWRLDIKRQYFQELNVYIVRQGQPPRRVLTHSETDSFTYRQIPNRFLEVDFHADAGEEVTFLIGLRSNSTTSIPLGVGKVDGVFLVHRAEMIIDSLLNGALVAMIILSLLLIPVIGRKLGVSFCLYMFFGMLFVGNADAYTFQFLWPNQPWLNFPVNLAAMLMMPATGLNFSRHLFRFREFAPRFDRLLLIVSITLTFLAAAAFALIQFSWFMIPAYSVIPFATSLQLVAGVLALRAGKVGARPYLFGALLVLASFLYATIAHLMPGQFNLDATLDFGHFTLLTESIAFGAAIMLRMRALARQRDAALEAEVEASARQLKLNQKLLQSRKDYDEARTLSDKRRDQLSAVSHDIRQPLYALRAALGRISGTNDDVSEQMNAAFDYLEDIAVSQIPSDADVTDTPVQEQAEEFPLNVVLDNVFELFADQAQAKKVDFRYRPSELTVRSNPVALMRAISNLVSNVITHCEDCALLLTARKREGFVRVEIWDTGGGMTDEEIHAAMKKGEKGEHSPGSGLGLAIVQEICDTHAMEFAFHSRKGKGSAAFIGVPASAES